MSEYAALTEKYQENIEILQNKFTNAKTNTKLEKQSLGQKCRRSDKSKNLQCTAKKEFSSFKKEQKKTSRGREPSSPPEATLKIIEMLSEAPSFTGLKSFETGAFRNGYHYY